MTSLESSSILSDPALLKQVAAKLEAELSLRQSRTKLFRYKPYSKQREFHRNGATHRERLLMAGNQLGKTIAGSMEAAMHATGLYPDDWPGRRFDKATSGWAAGVTGLATRDVVQKMLLGKFGDFGTGSIPHANLISHTPARGVAEAVDTIRVKHVTGGVSEIGLKSYEQGREKWQGPTLDWVWFDEEPEEDIYTEGLTRTNATGGLTWTTFTPLLGMSKVVKRFLIEKSPDRIVTTMRIEEAEHYTAAQRKSIIDSYPIHEREARANGVPVLGSGAVYPVTEDTIREEAVEIPKLWARIAGMDIGGQDHPTAVVWLAHDRDNDVVHVTDVYRKNNKGMEGTAPIATHSSAIKAKGKWIPVAWPHDALQRDKGGSCEQIAEQYRAEDVAMLPERATFEDGKSGVEAGISEILERMQTGRLKVAAHLNDWWEEFRLYHRKDGIIVKEGDDALDAMRYGIMMLREAITKPEPRKATHAGGGWAG
jgi:phage terminase large subunit-like protein